MILRNLDSVGGITSIPSEDGSEIVYWHNTDAVTGAIKQRFDENETDTPYGTVWSGAGPHSDIVQDLLVQHLE